MDDKFPHLKEFSRLMQAGQPDAARDYILSSPEAQAEVAAAMEQVSRAMDTIREQMAEVAVIMVDVWERVTETLAASRRIAGE